MGVVQVTEETAADAAEAFLVYLVEKDLHCLFGGSNGLAFWQITQSIRGLFLKECLCWYLCLTKVPLYRSSLGDTTESDLELVSTWVIGRLG